MCKLRFWGTEEQKPLLDKNTSVQTDNKKVKGKAPKYNRDNDSADQKETRIDIPTASKNNEEVPQNPGTTQIYTQMFFKYCGKSLIGTGCASTGLLVCADGVTTGLEHYNSQHPNIEHAASLITYISCAVAPTAFILGALALNYANKLKGLTAQEAQPSAEEVDKSQQATSSSKVDQSKQGEEDRFFELSRPI